jgi:glycosyltransferase involved in cell wall biosynthesis
MLSVIVPVYNAERYLEKCINSIICQTYSDLEIILVNDGSTDASGEVCNAFAKVDSRIKVIHIENSGAITARKKGVYSACGEVVTFVDSDDWIEPDMYDGLMNIYAQFRPDIVLSGFYTGNTNDVSIEDNFKEGFYDADQIKEIIIPQMMFNGYINTWGITASLWNKVFRIELLKRKIEAVSSCISLGDDASVVYPAVIEANSLYIIRRSWYHYIQNSNSMCHSCTFEDFAKVSLLQAEFEKRFKDYNIWNTMKLQLERYIRSVLTIVVRGVYGVELTNTPYLFPSELIPSKCRIILYGAGIVGRSYWNCLRTHKYAEVEAWVDEKYNEIEAYGGVRIKSPTILSGIEFDFVVIAVIDENIVEEIKGYLMELKIPKSKIVWTTPEYIG